MREGYKNVKLGRRLQKIAQMVKQPYTHIWDCCCDHGLLGVSLLTEDVAQTVHFVDIVPQLLKQIQDRLQTYWLGAKQSWQIHCLDVGKLPIKQLSVNPQTDTHLLIIAGIGGELLVDLLVRLLPACASLQCEFILCPVHHNYKVRQFLISHHFALINESLVFENNRGYEILHVAKGALQPLSPVGSIMWDLSNPKHRHYLQKNINHYQRMANNSQINVRHILYHYQQLA